MKSIEWLHEPRCASLNIQQLYLNVTLAQVLRRLWRVMSARCTRNTGYKGLTLCSSVCTLVDLTCAVKLNARRQVIKPLAVALFEWKLLLPSRVTNLQDSEICFGNLSTYLLNVNLLRTAGLRYCKIFLTRKRFNKTYLGHTVHSMANHTCPFSHCILTSKGYSAVCT